jgi:hypothetical protein
MRPLALAVLLPLAAAAARAQDLNAGTGDGAVSSARDLQKTWGAAGAQAAPFAANKPDARVTPEAALDEWSHACPAIAAYRASPHAARKRGLGVSTHYQPGPAVLSAIGASWYYTWTAVPMTGGKGEFVPLLQYPRNEKNDIPTLVKDLGALPPGTRYLLGFNEPDIGPKLPDPPTTQGAESLLARLMPMIPRGIKDDLKIGSPALASPVLYDKAAKRSEVNPWLKTFMDDSAGKAAKAPDERVDFVAAHLYSGIAIAKDDSPQAAAAKVHAAAKGFLDRLDALEAAYPGKDVWITEMGLMDRDATSADDVKFGPKDDACFMAEVLARLDSDGRVARYAWFNADPAAAKPLFPTLPGTLYKDGKTTPLALLYKQ